MMKLCSVQCIMIRLASDTALKQSHGESEVNSNDKTYVEITASKEPRSHQQLIGCHPAMWGIFRLLFWK